MTKQTHHTGKNAEEPRPAFNPKPKRSHNIAKCLSFLLIPFFLIFAYLNNITMLDVLCREGLSGNPNDPEKLLEHLRNIQVSNETLLSVQTGLIFSLLGMSFIDRKSLHLQRPHGAPEEQQRWFIKQKKRARHLSDEMTIQAITMMISAGVTGISSATFITRFQENTPGWESSLLATILFWIIYGIAFQYPEVITAASSTPEDILRLADIESAIATIEDMKKNRKPLSMRRMRRGRDDEEAAKRVSALLDQGEVAQSSPTGGEPHRGILAKIFHYFKTLGAKLSPKALRAKWTKPSVLGASITQLPIPILFSAIFGTEFQKSLAFTLCIAALTASSLSLLQKSAAERLSQRTYSSTYFLSWLSYLLHPLLFTTFILNSVAQFTSDHPTLDFITIATSPIYAPILLLSLIPSILFLFFTWGYWWRLLATPFQVLDERIINELLDHTHEELESEKHKILITVHSDHQEEQLISQDN